jgi:hypothetical protein
VLRQIAVDERDRMLDKNHWMRVPRASITGNRPSQAYAGGRA